MLINQKIEKQQNKIHIVKNLPSVAQEFRDLKKYIDCWKIIFPDAMLSDIVRFTNQQLQEMRQHYERKRDCIDTDIVEIQAFFDYYT